VKHLGSFGCALAMPMPGNNKTNSAVRVKKYFVLTLISIILINNKLQITNYKYLFIFYFSRSKRDPAYCGTIYFHIISLYFSIFLYFLFRSRIHFSISLRIILSHCSFVITPSIFLLFTKYVGVPRTPSSRPSRRSCWT